MTAEDASSQAQQYDFHATQADAYFEVHGHQIGTTDPDCSLCGPQY